MSHRILPTAAVIACDVHIKHRLGTDVFDFLVLDFCAQAIFYPLFFHFSFFVLGRVVALIAAGSLRMGRVLGLKLFQTKYYSTGFMLALGDVMLLLL